MSALRVRRSVLRKRRSIPRLYTPTDSSNGGAMRVLTLAVLLSLSACVHREGQSIFYRGGGYPIDDRIVKDALANDGAWKKLVELCDDVGHRLSGSSGMERAVEWAVATMRKDGHENVRAEPVKVPKWVRG